MREPYFQAASIKYGVWYSCITSPLFCCGLLLFFLISLIMFSLIYINVHLVCKAPSLFLVFFQPIGFFLVPRVLPTYKLLSCFSCFSPSPVFVHLSPPAPHPTLKFVFQCSLHWVICYGSLILVFLALPVSSTKLNPLHFVPFLLLHLGPIVTKTCFVVWRYQHELTIMHEKNERSCVLYI